MDALTIIGIIYCLIIVFLISFVSYSLGRMRELNWIGKYLYTLSEKKVQGVRR